MSSGFQFWLQLAVPFRYGSLLGAASGLFFVAWWTVLAPQRQALDAAGHQLAQQQQRLQQQQVQRARHPDIDVLEAELAQAATRQPAAQLTLEAIIAERGAQLEAWLSDEQPRALTLHLQWSQFQPLFTALSQSATAFPGRFQLTAHPAHLVAQLWLDADETF